MWRRLRHRTLNQGNSADSTVGPIKRRWWNIYPSEKNNGKTFNKRFVHVAPYALEESEGREKQTESAHGLRMFLPFCFAMVAKLFSIFAMVGRSSTMIQTRSNTSSAPDFGSLISCFHVDVSILKGHCCKVCLRAQLLRLSGAGDDPCIRHLWAHFHCWNSGLIWMWLGSLLRF